MPNTNPVDANGLYARAEERAYVAAEQLHRVFNSDATTEVEADDGLIPSVRKALTDNFYFKDPIDWVIDATETIFNQPRKFVNPTTPDDVTYWFAPGATTTNVIAMGGSPFGDDNWQPWINGYDKGNPLISWAVTVEQYGQKVINVPFKFKVVGNVFINGAHQDPNQAYKYDRKKRTVTFSQGLEIGDNVVIQFGVHGGIVPSLISQLEKLRDEAKEDADRAEYNADRAEQAADTAAEETAQKVGLMFPVNSGNWSTVAGTQLTESDRYKAWDYPDDSGERYAVRGNVSLPITIPSDPDDRFYLASAVNQIQLVSSIQDVTNAINISDLSDLVDNRDYIYSLNSDVYVKKGVTIKCNLLPTDDVTIFKGEGFLLTTDQWGNEHTFNIELSNKGSLFTPSGVINQALAGDVGKRIGIIGDSVTDGAWSSKWIEQPTGADGNLNSTDYNHNSAGGKNSWFARLGNALDRTDLNRGNFIYENISKSGQQLATGWAYKNFDYGFFQNSAYANKAPDVLYIAMGINDITQGSTDFELYLKEFDKLIRKAWGYGCAVGLVSVNTQYKQWVEFEASVKQGLTKKYINIDFIDIATYLQKRSNQGCYPSIKEMWFKTGRGWDDTHPEQSGHNAMGAYAAYCITPWRYLNNDINVILNNKQINCDLVSGGQVGVQIESVSGSYLDEFGGWGVIKPRAPVTIRYEVWVNDNNKSITLFSPFSASSIDSNVSVKLMHDWYWNTITDAIVKKPIDGTYTTWQLVDIRQGLNIVEVTYSGNGSNIYIPALLITRENASSSADNIYRQLSANSEVFACGGNEPKLLLQSYTDSDISGDFQDKVVGASYATQRAISFSTGQDNVGAVFGAKRNVNGVYIAPLGDSCKIYSKSAAIFTELTTLNVNCVDGWSVVAVENDNGLTITVIAGNSMLTYEAVGYFGGRMMVFNNNPSDSNIVYSVSSVYL